MARSSKEVDLLKGLIPVNPEELGLTEDPFVYDGKNIMPTAMGYEAFFGRDVSLGTDLLEVPAQVGAELINNPGFDADTDWTKGTGWTIAAGVASCATALDWQYLFQAVAATLVEGTRYRVTFTISNYSAGGARVVLNTTTSPTYTADGTYVWEVTLNPFASEQIGISSVIGGFTGDIDNFSVKVLTPAVAPIIQEIISYQTFGGDVLQIAFTSEGLFIKTLQQQLSAPTIVDITASITVTMDNGLDWVQLIELSSTLWTYAVIANKLYVYAQGLPYIGYIEQVKPGELIINKLIPSFLANTAGGATTIVIQNAIEDDNSSYKTITLDGVDYSAFTALKKTHMVDKVNQALVDRLNLNPTIQAKLMPGTDSLVTTPSDIFVAPVRVAVSNPSADTYPQSFTSWDTWIYEAEDAAGDPLTSIPYSSDDPGGEITQIVWSTAATQADDIRIQSFRSTMSYIHLLPHTVWERPVPDWDTTNLTIGYGYASTYDTDLDITLTFTSGSVNITAPTGTSPAALLEIIYNKIITIANTNISGLAIEEVTAGSGGAHQLATISLQQPFLTFEGVTINNNVPATDTLATYNTYGYRSIPITNEVVKYKNYSRIYVAPAMATSVADITIVKGGTTFNYNWAAAGVEDLTTRIAHFSAAVVAAFPDVTVSDEASGPGRAISIKWFDLIYLAHDYLAPRIVSNADQTVVATTHDHETDLYGLVNLLSRTDGKATHNSTAFELTSLYFTEDQDSNDIPEILKAALEVNGWDSIDTPAWCGGGGD